MEAGPVWDAPRMAPSASWSAELPAAAWRGGPATALHRDGTLLRVNVLVRPLARGAAVWVAHAHDDDDAAVPPPTPPSPPSALLPDTDLLADHPAPHPAPHPDVSADRAAAERELRDADPPRRDDPAERDARPAEPDTPPLSPQPAAPPAPPCIDDYTVTRSLGEGTYGFVRLAYRNADPNRTPLVIKYVVKSRVLSWCRKEHLGGRVPVEVAVLDALRAAPHPAVALMLETFDDDFFVYIVMQHDSSMDLFEFIEANDSLPEVSIKLIFRQVADAVRHLHTLGIVHRDIKDENVVIDPASLRVSLIDFGSSAFLDRAKPFWTFYGTMDFAAPEVLEGNPYDGRPQDIWALGILLYTLIYRENPFYSVDEILAESGLRIPFVLSPLSLDLLQQMLSRDLSKRPDIAAVLAHPWLADCQDAQAAS
ncbi:serine/threonine protein kinase [Polyrhizophydium stewartii]|uniref:Serine/threonine protein kinase n=1 Tax=Polyrhizophydium stewartii TaxID=2732419 RepID=A0ABR4N4V8_9FUNG